MQTCFCVASLLKHYFLVCNKRYFITEVSAYNSRFVNIMQTTEMGLSRCHNLSKPVEERKRKCISKNLFLMPGSTETPQTRAHEGIGIANT